MEWLGGLFEGLFGAPSDDGDAESVEWEGAIELNTFAVGTEEYDAADGSDDEDEQKDDAGSVGKSASRRVRGRNSAREGETLYEWSAPFLPKQVTFAVGDSDRNEATLKRIRDAVSDIAERTRKFLYILPNSPITPKDAVALLRTAVAPLLTHVRTWPGASSGDDEYG